MILRVSESAVRRNDEQPSEGSGEPNSTEEAATKVQPTETQRVDQMLQMEYNMDVLNRMRTQKQRDKEENTIILSVYNYAEALRTFAGIDLPSETVLRMERDQLDELYERLGPNDYECLYPYPTYQASAKLCESEDETSDIED